MIQWYRSCRRLRESNNQSSHLQYISSHFFISNSRSAAHFVAESIIITMLHLTFLFAFMIYFKIPKIVIEKDCDIYDYAFFHNQLTFIIIGL